LRCEWLKLQYRSIVSSHHFLLHVLSSQLQVSGVHEYAEYLTELSATQEGRTYIFQHVANLLSDSWETQKLSPDDQRTFTVTPKPRVPAQTTIPQHSPSHQSSMTCTSSPSADSTSSDSEDSEDEVINFRPGDQKPSFKFEPSALGASLPSFLAALKSSNDGLAAGIPEDQKFELSNSDSDEPHIEMNLGLGVLEDTAASIDTPVSISKKRSSLSDDEDECKRFEPTVQQDSPSKKLKLLHTRKTHNPAIQSTLSSTTTSRSNSHQNNTLRVQLKFMPRLGSNNIVRPSENGSSINSSSKLDLSIKTSDLLASPKPTTSRYQSPVDSELLITFQTLSETQMFLVSDSLVAARLEHFSLPDSKFKNPSGSVYTEPSEEETSDLLDSVLTYLRTGNLEGFKNLSFA
jgi:hypothetical protein